MGRVNFGGVSVRDIFGELVIKKVSHYLYLDHLVVLIVMVVAFQVAGKAINEQRDQIPNSTAITTSLKMIFLVF